jgi:hypothetical protein
MACTDVILQRISDPATFTTWKTATAASISGIVATTPVTTIEALETDMANTLGCTQTKITEKMHLSTNVSNLHDTHASARTDLEAKKEALSIAKERAALLNAPQNHTTVYESWFPLHRPLKTSTFLLLIVFALFFLSLFLGLLMRQMGIFVDLGYEFIPSGPTAQASWLAKQLTPVTLGIGAALVASLAVIIYLVTKK